MISTMLGFAPAVCAAPIRAMTEQPIKPRMQPLMSIIGSRFLTDLSTGRCGWFILLVPRRQIHMKLPALFERKLPAHVFAKRPQQVFHLHQKYAHHRIAASRNESATVRSDHEASHLVAVSPQNSHGPTDVG